MEYVYCFQVGSEDCFKVGRTKNDPEERRYGISVGSPQKLTLYRTIETEDASRLEGYVHKALELNRTENGEFFRVEALELDNTIDRGLAFLCKTLPLSKQVEEFKKTKPTERMRDPSESDWIYHNELREAQKEMFLLTQRIEFLQSQLKVAIGEDLGIEGIASWKWQETARFSIPLFREKKPKLYEKYKKVSATRVFRLLR